MGAARSAALTVSDPLPTLWRESSGAPASGQVKARAPITFLIKEPNYAKIYSRDAHCFADKLPTIMELNGMREHWCGHEKG
jgi:hypothetical protein